MSTPAPIVVGVDGSPASDEAVRWATLEAVRHHAPLHLVHALAAPIDFGPGIGVMPLDYESYRKDGEALMAASARVATETATAIPNRTQDLALSTFVVDPPPIPVLTGRSEHARMVVVGTRGMGAIRAGLLGSVCSALARHALCPVAIIPAFDPNHADRSEGPVVVGVDGSPCSTEAIHLAFDEASCRNAELVAVHSWNEDGRLLAMAQVQEEGTELLAENLAGYAEEYPDVHVHRVVTEDRPAKTLLHAGDTAQLLILGSHGRGGFARMTLGSVSQAVLHGTDCPLVIVRQFDATRKA